MAGKKITIEKFAEKNSLRSIFTDDVMRREFERRVYRENSFPLFTYRDDAHRENQEKWDLVNFYARGSDVRVKVYEDIKIGKVASYVPFSPIITVIIDGKLEKHSINLVTRIL